MFQSWNSEYQVSDEIGCSAATECGKPEAKVYFAESMNFVLLFEKSSHIGRLGFGSSPTKKSLFPALRWGHSS